MELFAPARLRAWWSHRQGLDSVDPIASPSQVLANIGWARSVGGANPYLTLFSRASISRERIDQAIASLEIHELPSARGCTYIIPREHFALALKVGQGFSDQASMNTARNFLGVTDAEIEHLMAKVEDALKSGAMDPKELKEAVGDAARSLGEEGKKRGQTTTLPLALGFLQSQGRIRRVPTNGRLDQQRYSYCLWNPSPLGAFNLSKEEAYANLADLYFRWAGPATQVNFQWFSGLGVKAAKNAMESADIDRLENSEYFLDRESEEGFRTFQMLETPAYALISGIDSHFLLRRDLSMLIDDGDRSKQIVGEKGPAPIGGLSDLPNNAIIDRGRIVGIWEFDPEAGELVHSTFIPVSKDLEAAIERTAEFAKNELGDVRSFSLDSPASRKGKLTEIRAMAQLATC